MWIHFNMQDHIGRMYTNYGLRSLSLITPTCHIVKARRPTFVNGVPRQILHNSTENHADPLAGLGTYQQDRIRSAFLAGRSQAEVARMFRISRRQVRNIVAMIQEQEPAQYSARMVHLEHQKKNLRTWVVEAMKECGYSNASKIAAHVQNRYDVKISKTSVHRYLRMEGFVSYATIPRPFLSPEVCAKRLAMAQELLAWPERELEKLVFLDETKVSFSSCHVKKRVFVNAEEMHNTGIVPPQVFDETDRRKNYSVNVIATLHYKCQAWPSFIFQNVNSLAYAGALDDILPPYYREYGQSRETAILYHDNAPIHKTAQAREAESRYFSKVIDAPPYSPDLNPIENMWAELKKSVRLKEDSCNSLEEFRTLVSFCWNDLPTGDANNTWDEFAKRLKRVVAVQGHHISEHARFKRQHH